MKTAHQDVTRHIASSADVLRVLARRVERLGVRQDPERVLIEKVKIVDALDRLARELRRDR